LRGDIPNAGGVIALFSEVSHGHLDDARSFGLGTRAWWNVAAISGWADQAAGNSAHILTSSQEKIQKNTCDFNFIISTFCANVLAHRWESV
jgi:hypothetical protein